jgi:hypothetical protein
MKSAVHRMTEDISKALGPIFQKNPDYETIFPAMCMCMARVIQSTPDRGDELLVMEDAYNEIKHALNQFLAIEREKEAKAKVVVEGIDGFSGLARAEERPVIEPGSAGDYPDNPNQNVAKTVAPFNPEVQEALVEEERAFHELTKLPEGIQTPEGVFGNPEIFTDPHGVFVEPPANDEYTPGEGPYSEPQGGCGASQTSSAIQVPQSTPRPV